MNTTTPTKACRLCGGQKPLRDFLLDHGARDGRDNRCRPCVLAQRQRRRKRAARRAAAEPRAFSWTERRAAKEAKPAEPVLSLDDRRRMLYDAALEFARSAIDADGELALTDDHWAVLRTPAPSLTRNLLLRVLAEADYDVVVHLPDGSERVINDYPTTRR